MRFTNQEAGVNAVKFFPSGDSLASAGDDGGVSWWVHGGWACVGLGWNFIRHYTVN